ncbi:MAG: sugar phosphate isomerase/epimerase family protein [Armatimonadaceae bacterium]
MRFSLAFSTLGCPSWHIDQILDCAVTNGFHSVELRGYLQSMDLPTAEPFHPDQRAATRKRFDDAGIGFCCIGSSANAGQAQPDHVDAHCRLAADLGCSLVRVFPGEFGPETIANLRTYGDIAARHGVDIVLETHDHGSTGAQLGPLLERANHPNVRALWDLHHPFRQGEAPAETLRLLLPNLRHVHVKDSRDGVYCLPGEGDVPLETMLTMLAESGWQGTVSVEWEKRWCPEIPEPEIALPAYARFLRQRLQ